MYKLFFRNHFVKKYNKLIGKNKKLEKNIDKTLQQLEKNPFYKALKTHKVNIKYDNKSGYSSWASGNIRIIWRFKEEEVDIIDIIDIGGHKGKSKVYK